MAIGRGKKIGPGALAGLKTAMILTPEWFDEPAHFDKGRPRTTYRTVWISDTHLGTPGCNAELLLDFLRSTDCQTLYLVGDIVDGWQLRKGWYWPSRHNDVVRCVLKQAKRGTRVVYVPGNHDEAFRDYVGLHFGGVEIMPEAIHETADGRKLLIVHGDEFDGVVRALATTAERLHASGHDVLTITPAKFRTIGCPTYPEIRLAILPGKRVRRLLNLFAPEAVRGPLDIVGADGCGLNGGTLRVGALDEDLSRAIVVALTADRAACRAEAARYDWSRCTQAFVAGLATRRVMAVSGALALA